MNATLKLVHRVGAISRRRKTYEVFQTSDGKSFVARLVTFGTSAESGPWSEPFDTEDEAIKSAWKLWATPIAQWQREKAEYYRSGGY